MIAHFPRQDGFKALAQRLVKPTQSDGEQRIAEAGLFLIRGKTVRQGVLVNRRTQGKQPGIGTTLEPQPFEISDAVANGGNALVVEKRQLAHSLAGNCRTNGRRRGERQPGLLNVGLNDTSSA